MVKRYLLGRVNMNYLTLFWLGGKFAPLVDFLTCFLLDCPPNRLNKSARKNFIAMKLLDFLQLLILQLLKKFHWNILKNEGAGDNSDPGKIANSQMSIIAKKGAEAENFANVFCNVVLFDAFYHKYHVWMENVIQSSFYRDFLDFGQFCRSS